MKNLNITNKISQGMYVLTTIDAGCIVDSVSQISGGENPLIAVSVMKKNNTNDVMKLNKSFAISVLSENVDPEIIKIFGFNSMRDINKFEKIKTKEICGLNVIEDSIGFMICEIIDYIDNETHTLYIGKIVEADMFKDEKSMTYSYYQEHKEELLMVKTAENKIAWICTVCGYICYDKELPYNYKCPICGVEKKYFEKKND